MPFTFFEIGFPRLSLITSDEVLFAYTVVEDVVPFELLVGIQNPYHRPEGQNSYQHFCFIILVVAKKYLIPFHTVI